MNSPISSNPIHAPVSGGEIPRVYYSTVRLLQMSADVILHPVWFPAADREWLSGQLQQRAAAMIEDGAPLEPRRG